MDEMVELLKRELPGTLCEESDCLLCYYKRDNKIAVIALTKGKMYYAKVVPFHRAPVSITCESLFLVPHGLYAFGKDPKELVEKLKQKLENVLRSD